ncbi:MAG: DUF429 domain-containing protein [Anaerolineales bacterium]|nr:DUF429 domain-containing protein [Anaerolineae bacterium]PWB52349.1 MAG: DUF429 domain-containing protein [Anaerolineales bacterium]
MAFRDVSLIAHVDWSVNPTKCWVAVAAKQPDRHWIITELNNVSAPGGIFRHLVSSLQVHGCVLAGFDFPIGLPIAYAQKVHITDYLSALVNFGYPDWESFYSPCDFAEEISLHRPFYPARPGGAKRAFLEHSLDLSFAQLYRLCEIAHDSRRSACPLFWTLGSQQVGKAAISGWRDLLTPALTDKSQNLTIWPFSGSLENCCLPGNLVALETYPAEFYHHLGLSFTSPILKSKRCHQDRLSFAEPLLSWAQSHNIHLKPGVRSDILDGFGDCPEGEDRFDALVGLYGMINVVQGHHPTGEPLAPYLSKIEGWIFGQEGHHR